MQIVSGLKRDDHVIQDPPDSLIEGEKLTVVKPSAQNVETAGQPAA